MQQLRSAIHNAIARFLKNQPPARIIAVGFALLILLGAALLMLPFAAHPGAHVGPLDALFTATRASRPSAWGWRWSPGGASA